MSGWLISPRIDVSLMMLPAWLAVLLGFLLPNTDAPLWVYVVAVMMVDVGHVWSSLFRVYLDHSTFQKMPRFFVALPIIVAILCLGTNFLVPEFFWRGLAYLAVLHFMRQQLGFLAIYQRKAGLKIGGAVERVERLLCWLLMIVPVLWWHSKLPREFAWFMSGDFITGLPSLIVDVSMGVLLVVLLMFLLLRIRCGLGPSPRDLWLLTTAMVWFGGIVWTNSDLAFTLSNCIAHGLPYMVLVWWTGHRQWKVLNEGPRPPELFQHSNKAWVFLLILLILGTLEEYSWDTLVWHDHPQIFGSGWTLNDSWVWIAVGLLSVPQVTHYLLDGVIWRGNMFPELRLLFRDDD